MATKHNFNEILKNLNQRNPNFDVRLLLPMLVAQEVIGDHDRSVIEKKKPIEAAIYLFKHIIPVKADRIQQEFFELIQQQGILDLAATDEFKEFLRHLSVLQFDVLFLLPKLTPDILDNNEQEIVKHAATPADAANILFLHYMPHKGRKQQQRFIEILTENNMPKLADFLAPKIDRFYAQTNAENTHATTQPQRPSAPAPGPFSQLKPAQGQVQPINRVPAPSPFTNVQVVRTLHTAGAYKIEYEALIKSIGAVPDTRGKINFNIEQMTQHPTDWFENKYYGKNGNRWALVINNHKYDNLPDDDPQTMNRTGSLVDYENMTNLLQGLGYIGTRLVGKTDRNGQQMLDDVKEFADDMANEGDIHSCVVVVMTHGERGSFVGVDNQMLEQRRFFKVITENKALAGKPKIFIIQACRGCRINQGVRPDTIIPTIVEEEAIAASMNKIATGADTCILYSTTPGYFSWRDTEKGSWFLQAICQEFAAHVHKPWADLLTLSVNVTGKLAEQFHVVQFENTQGGYDFYCVVQLPTTEMNMRKKFHFFAGQDQGHFP